MHLDVMSARMRVGNGDPWSRRGGRARRVWLRVALRAGTRMSKPASRVGSVVTCVGQSCNSL